MCLGLCQPLMTLPVPISVTNGVRPIEVSNLQQQLSTMRRREQGVNLSLLLALEVVLFSCGFVIEAASILHSHHVTFLWLVGAVAWQSYSLRNTHVEDLVVNVRMNDELEVGIYDRVW